MDGSARISFVWGDGEHTFRLGLRELRKVQDKTGLGPEALYGRIAAGLWRVDDLRETILQGLIGGGTPGEAAVKLVAEWVEGRPLMDSKTPALAIIGASLLGADGDDTPKKEAAAGTAAEAPTASPSVNSSEAPPPSD